MLWRFLMKGSLCFIDISTTPTTSMEYGCWRCGSLANKLPCGNHTRFPPAGNIESSPRLAECHGIWECVSHLLGMVWEQVPVLRGTLCVQLEWGVHRRGLQSKQGENTPIKTLPGPNSTSPYPSCQVTHFIKSSLSFYPSWSIPMVNHQLLR